MAGAAVKHTHKYIAGVVYKNDSEVETSVAGPIAQTQVVLTANRSRENVTSGTIM